MNNLFLSGCDSDVNKTGLETWTTAYSLSFSYKLLFNLSTNESSKEKREGKVLRVLTIQHIESITDWRENLSLSLISLTIGSWLSENKNKDNKEESKSQ